MVAARVSETQEQIDHGQNIGISFFFFFTVEKLQKCKKPAYCSVLKVKVEKVFRKNAYYGQSKKVRTEGGLWL